MYYQDKNVKFKNKKIDQLEKKELDEIFNFYIEFNQKKAIEHLWTLINIGKEEINVPLLADCHKMVSEIYHEKSKVNKEKQKKYVLISYNHTQKARSILKKYIKKEKNNVEIDIIEELMEATFRLSSQLLDSFYEPNKNKEKKSNQRNNKYKKKCLRYLNQIIKHEKSEATGKLLFLKVASILNTASLYRQEDFSAQYNEALRLYCEALKLLENNSKAIDAAKGKDTANNLIESLLVNIYATKEELEVGYKINSEIKTISPATGKD